MLIYDNGIHKQEVYGLRNPIPEYYNPMINNLVDWNNPNFIQVLVKFLTGDLIWINIKKSQLTWVNI